MPFSSQELGFKSGSLKAGLAGLVSAPNLEQNFQKLIIRATTAASYRAKKNFRILIFCTLFKNLPNKSIGLIYAQPQGMSVSHAKTV